MCENTNKKKTLKKTWSEIFPHCQNVTEQGKGKEKQKCNGHKIYIYIP